MNQQTPPEEGAATDGEPSGAPVSRHAAAMDSTKRSAQSATDEAAKSEVNAPGGDGRSAIFLFLLGVPLAIGAAVFAFKDADEPTATAAVSSPTVAARTGEAGESSWLKRASARGENASLEERLSFAQRDDALTPIEPFRSIQAPPDADEPMSLQSWSSGAPKILAREWSDAGAAIEEQCFFSPDEKPLGCGVLREGERWEGVFVQWATPPGKPFAEASVLREIVSYREGQKDGLARAYRFDGTPMLETLFREGRQVSKRVFRQGDNEIIELGAKRLKGLPVSRRTRNTDN